MKTNYFFAKASPVFLMTGLLLFLVTSCGSYQNSSYYDRDGVYGNAVNKTAENTTATPENNTYKDYFGSLKVDGQTTQTTDTVNDSSANNAINQQNAVAQANNDGYWGANQEQVTINVYGNNWGYNSGWNYYNWNNPYYGWGYNSWYAPYYGWSWYGPSFGYNYWGYNNWYGYNYGCGNQNYYGNQYGNYGYSHGRRDTDYRYGRREMSYNYADRNNNTGRRENQGRSNSNYIRRTETTNSSPIRNTNVSPVRNYSQVPVRTQTTTVPVRTNTNYTPTRTETYTPRTPSPSSNSNSGNYNNGNSNSGSGRSSSGSGRRG